MSTNKTSNFGLNQWEPGDQVLREEFNTDNQKIDSALARKQELELIKELTTDAATRLLRLDVSDIDWAQWRYVVLQLKIKHISGGLIDLLVNGDKGGCSFYPLGSLNASTEGLARIGFLATQQVVFFPLGDARRQVTCQVITDSFGFGTNNRVTYQTFTKLDLQSFGNSSDILAGSTVTFYGLR